MTVEPGDHVWAIAEDTLTETWGRAPSDDEIVPYWHQLVDENRDRLLPPGDPDLIYPEQQITIPPSPPPSPSTARRTLSRHLLRRWRRRTAMQQRLPGLRFPTPLPETMAETMAEEAKLSAVAVPERTLDDLAAMVATLPADTHPVFVTTTDDGDITLLFDEHDDLPDPLAPWELAHDGTNGPVGWRAEVGSRGADRGIGLPLLVTSRISVPVEVAASGGDRLGTLDRVRFIDDPAEEIRLGMEEIEQDIVLDDRTPRLLVCHRDIEPPVVPTDLRGTVGVVAEPSGEAWVLELEDEQTGRLHLPGGATVSLTLPDVDPDLVDDELTRLDATPLQGQTPWLLTLEGGGLLAGDAGLAVTKLPRRLERVEGPSESASADGAEPAWRAVQFTRW